MSGRKAHGKEGDPAEIMTHYCAKGGDSGQMVRSQAVKNSCQEYRKKQHANGT